MNFSGLSVHMCKVRIFVSSSSTTFPQRQLMRQGFRSPHLGDDLSKHVRGQGSEARRGQYRVCQQVSYHREHLQRSLTETLSEFPE